MAITAKFLADFDDFDKEVKQAKGGLDDFEKAAGNVARNIQSDLLAMFSVGAAVAFVADTVAAAGALKVLSQQTQISTDDLQIMAAAMSEFGVSQDELGRGLTTLSKKIAGGEDSVAGALARMGLSLEDVKDLRGEELFLTIEKGLASLNGALRDTTAATLYGDKLGASMAGASEGIDGTMTKARELNTVMSKEAIDALDKYSAEMTRAKTNMQNMVANGLGPLAEGFNVLVDAVQRGADKWELFAGLLPKGLGGFGTGVAGLADTLDRLNQKTDQNTVATQAAAAAHGQVTVKLTEEQRAAEFLRILQQNASQELTEAQRKNLEALKAIGQLNAQNAEGVGVSAAAYKKYVEEIDRAKQAAADLAKAQKEADALALTSYKAHIDNLRTMTEQRMTAYGTVAQIDMLRQLDTAELALTRSVYANINSEKERLTLVEQSGQRRLAITGQIMAKEAELTAEIGKQLLAEAQAHQRRNAAQGLDAAGNIKVESSLETLRVKTAELQALERAGVSTRERQAELVDEFAQANLQAAIETDKANAAYNKSKDAAAAIPGAMAPAKASIDAIGAAAGQAADNFFSMSAELYNAIRAAQNADAMNSLVPAWGITHPAPGQGIIRNTQPAVSVNINSPLGTPDQIARAVGGAVTGSYASGGKRLPV